MTKFECANGDTGRCPQGELLRVRGEGLQQETGPVRIKSRDAGLSRPSRRLRVLAAVAPGGQPLPVVPAGEGVFPVHGKYDFGTEINGFGGGHKGQDIFATCGTPLVSARIGIVTVVTSEARAGNYTVITADDGTSQAYMHLLQSATVMRDQRVTARQPIGQVGQSGRATGCHPHFELWTAPGWYQGGTAVDPLPELQQYATRG